MVSKKIFHYSYGKGIEKSVTHNHHCHHLASLLIPSGDPRDGFFYPSLTLKIHSYILMDIDTYVNCLFFQSTFTVYLALYDW